MLGVLGTFTTAVRGNIFANPYFILFEHWWIFCYREEDRGIEPLPLPAAQRSKLIVPMDAISRSLVRPPGAILLDHDCFHLSDFGAARNGHEASIYDLLDVLTNVLIGMQHNYHCGIAVNAWIMVNVGPQNFSESH